MPKNIFQVLLKTFIVISLSLIYFFCFGLTLLFVIFFKRSLLAEPDPRSLTFWKSPQGYEPDMSDCLRQS